MSGLWAGLTLTTPTPSLREMLIGAAGDIDVATGNKLGFFVDTIGVARATKSLRYNCYLRVNRTGYLHLFFQVETPFPGPFPAQVNTPEGDTYLPVNTEEELKDVVAQVIQRPRTNDIVFFLLNAVS